MVAQDGTVQYLIKWLGYSDEQNTWQYPSDLDCPVLLENFKQKLAADPTLNRTPTCMQFPPTALLDGWSELVESVSGLRERIEDTGVKSLLVRINW